MKRFAVTALALLAAAVFLCTPAWAERKENEVRRIEINLVTTTVRVNQTRTLWVAYLPTYAEDQSVYWETADPEIAVVEIIDGNGVVTGVSPGTTTITATTPNGKTASCTVTVPAAVLGEIHQDATNSDLTEATVNAGVSLSASTLRVDVEAAVKEAGAGNTATVMYRDKAKVSTAALRGAAFTAGYGNGQVAVKFLTPASSDKGGGIQGQLTVDPAKAPAEDATLLVGVAVDGISNPGAQLFGSDAAVVRLSQQGSFGMPVGVAARVDLKGMDQNSLRLYSWQEAAGTYSLLDSQTCRIDGNGYLHFNTNHGGTVVITDRQLK